MKITLAQMNPIVGDIEGNLEKIINTLSNIADESSDLLIFPELCIVGYPPRDLLERQWYITNIQKAIDTLLDISTKYPQTGLLIGTPQRTKKEAGRGLYNSALLMYQGRILMSQHKSLLPTYDVFDETRYFDPAAEIHVIPFKEELLGVSICEDAWNDPELWPKRFYPFDPQEYLAQQGATVFINISASPFHMGKEDVRFRIFQNHAKKHKIPFIFVNQVGGNDELIFDGRSMCIDQYGNPIAMLPPFKEAVETIDIKHPGRADLYQPQDIVESIYQALILGVRDYVQKCGFSKVVIGVSGGIDSAVVCCLATAALGSNKVLGITMPGPYSSTGSVEDSKHLADNLGIKLSKIAITPIYTSYINALKQQMKLVEEVDVTRENIQARIRGNILMAIANKFGYLVLSTGNKSELAVGYCTLYGDMTGGLAVISDVPKTMVYHLATYINKKTAAIPKKIIDKVPSAELKPDQQDHDTLPPYDVLDPILRYYVDEGYSPDDILDLNFDPNIVKWVIKAVDSNEYKRRQAPPGLKVTPKAFGVGRRMPIAAKYKL